MIKQRRKIRPRGVYAKALDATIKGMWQTMGMYADLCIIGGWKRPHRSTMRLRDRRRYARRNRRRT